MNKLLLLDREVSNLHRLDLLLNPEYDCFNAVSMGEALVLMDQYELNVVVASTSVVNLSFLQEIRKGRRDLRIVLMSADIDATFLIDVINSGVIDQFVVEPWDEVSVKNAVARAASNSLREKREAKLRTGHDQLVSSMKQIKSGMVRSLAGLLKVKDKRAYDRGLRAADLVTAIAADFSFSEELLEDLWAAALLHEFRIISSVPEFSTPPDSTKRDQAAEILSSFPGFSDIGKIIRFQYENFDGSGFPLGLGRHQIPIASRILRVATEYDSLRHPENFASRVSHDDAVDRLLKVAGSKVDPDVVTALTDLGKSDMKQLQRLSSIPFSSELITVAIN